MHVYPAEDDPIICEIRRFREEYAASFGYDMDLMREDVRRSTADWPGRRVSYDHQDPERNVDVPPDAAAETTARKR
jgi:hypothetical protein